MDTLKYHPSKKGLAVPSKWYLQNYLATLSDTLAQATAHGSKYTAIAFAIAGYSVWGGPALGVEAFRVKNGFLLIAAISRLNRLNQQSFSASAAHKAELSMGRPNITMTHNEKKTAAN